MVGGRTNEVLRRRIEFAIRLLSPVLDLLLFTGERLSRVLEPDDPTYAPVRMPSPGDSAPRGIQTGGPRAPARG
jgi:hypothetical protein